jgi:hypothetical protein
LAVCLLLSASPARVDADLSSKEAAALVSEYLDENCAAERRAAIVVELRKGTRPEVLFTQLKRASGKDETRALAVTLSTHLRLGGLFKTIKKEIDGPHESIILTYLFTTQDSGSMDFLFDRWKDNAIDSQPYSRVTDGFNMHYVPLDTMGKFRDYLKHKDAVEEKKPVARQILLQQMDKDPQDTTLDIEETWREYYVEHKTNSMRFSIAGTDVLKLPGWHFDGRIRKYGDNYKYFAPARMLLTRIPDTWQKQNFTFKVGVRVTGGEGGMIGWGTSGMEPDRSWGPTVIGEAWVLRFSGGVTKSVKLQPGTWQTITFDFRYSNDSRVEYMRWVTVDIDGEVVAKELLFSGKFERLIVATGETCQLVVGGIDYAEPRG